MQPLPDGTHLLHIGPQKTGSTSIQAALHRARPVLAEHGVLYPGPTMRPLEAAGAGLGFARPSGAPAARLERWHDLLRQVHEPGHRIVCVSHEAFGRATDDRARQVVETLGGEHPHVLAVVRGYAGLMPSQWQQRVKAKKRLSYDEWLRVVLGEPRPKDPVWANLWVPHDTVALARRWSAVVGEQNVTLVVGDGTRQQLPRTFERLLGVPEGLLETAGDTRNRSLSYGEVELLRAVNVLAHERGWSDREYFRLVKRGLIPALVRTDKVPGDPAIPPLPGWAAQRLAELSDERIEGLSGLGVRIIGDLEDLRMTPPEAGATDPPALDTVSLVTATRALDGMARGALKKRKRGSRKRPAGPRQVPEKPSLARRVSRRFRG